MTKTNERGAIMVEVISVLALLGTMGTVLFRQILQRNEELENVNMASEMRIMKEALTAYIQADKATLESGTCVASSQSDVEQCAISSSAIADEVKAFVPDGYGSTVDSYNFYLFTYILDPDLAPRQVIYGMVFPKGVTDDESILPGNMNLMRAARVANLIGADGGVFYGNEDDDGDDAGFKMVHGTLGGWSLECPNDTACPNNEPMYAAITGTDIFIPEAEQPETPKAKVAMPLSVAFQRLHSYDYFSVGGRDSDGNVNCVQLENGALPRTLNEDGTANPDEIFDPGYKGCEPLFWVGADYYAGENTSEKGQVYVKNNLYIGRDNTNDRHAVAIENSNGNRIQVFNTTGTERLTLNGSGQVVARNRDGLETVRIDGTNGQITLNEQDVEIDFNGEKTTVSVPSLLISSRGTIETNKQGAFYNSDGEVVKATYRLDPAYTSLMNDIRLTSRGGARLSEILPNYIMRTVQVHQFENSDKWKVSKPECPKGYAKAIIVTPTAWSQYVTSAELTLKHSGSFKTGSSGGTGDHTHTVDATKINDISITATADKGKDDTSITTGSTDTNGNQLTLKHRGAVVLGITSSGNNWEVTATYEDGAASEKDPITVMAQTYCVFDKENFTQGTNFEGKNATGVISHDNTEVVKDDGVLDNNQDRTETGGNVSCDTNNDCTMTEYCTGGTCSPLSTLGTCSKDDTTSVDGIYCANGIWISISCVKDTDCETGSSCIDYKCVASK